MQEKMSPIFDWRHSMRLYYRCIGWRITKIGSWNNAKLVVSGINLGPNLSQDAYHSGTIAAVKQECMECQQSHLPGPHLTLKGWKLQLMQQCN